MTDDDDPRVSERRGAVRDEALDRVVQWGDPVLRTPTRDVVVFDGALADAAASMADIMARADGAGLAAPQIGSLQRLLVYAPAEDAPSRALVNARVREAATETDVALEGCLSLGRARVALEIERPVWVRVEAQEVDGTPIEIEAVGREARVLQHEIDHLDGILMLQRAPADQRREAVRALREGRAWQPPHLVADADAASPETP